MLVAVVVLAVVTIAAERGWLGMQLPLHPRQVDESWTTRYRRFLYAGGYGVQIGAGFATYIMTTAVYLTAALAVLTADPVAAFAVGVIFGAIRGLAIVIGAAGTRPERLRSIHRTLDGLAPASVVAAVGVQIVAAVAAAGLLAGSAIPGVVGVLAMGAVVAVLAGRVLSPSRPDPAPASGAQPESRATPTGRPNLPWFQLDQTGDGRRRTPDRPRDVAPSMHRRRHRRTARRTRSTGAA